MVQTQGGMVLVVSIWDDGATNMNWLDSCLVADYQVERGVLGGKRHVCRLH